MTVVRRVATGWTGVYTTLLPEVVPESDANPVSFYCGREGGRSVSRFRTLISMTVLHVSDDSAGDDNTVLYLQFFLTDV